MFDAETDKATPETTGEGFTSGSTYSVAGMTLYLACRSYAKRGTLEEFQRIADRVIREFWNDDGEYQDTNDGEACREALKRLHDIPPSPKAGGGGHERRAKSEVAQGQMTLAVPARPHSRTTRDIQSILAVEPTIAKGLLEMRKTHDGRVWGSVCWHELDGMDRDGTIARLDTSRVAI